METQTTEKKKDAVQEFFDRTYNLAIDHSIETVRKLLIDLPGLANPLIEKLEALKS